MSTLDDKGKGREISPHPRLEEIGGDSVPNGNRSNTVSNRQALTDLFELSESSPPSSVVPEKPPSAVPEKFVQEPPSSKHQSLIVQWVIPCLIFRG